METRRVIPESDSEEELTFTQQCDKNIKKEIAYRRRKEREWKKQDDVREEKHKQTLQASIKREQEEKKKKLEYIHRECERIDNEYYEKIVDITEQTKRQFNAILNSRRKEAEEIRDKKKKEIKIMLGAVDLL